MTSLLILSKNLYRKNDTLTSFLIAMNIILILNPYNIESIGMWLSFLGTAGLVILNLKFSLELKCKYSLKEFFSKKDLKILFLILKQSFISSLETSISVYLMIFMITLYVFNTISITFFISNFLVSFIIGPILILGYLSLFFGKFIRIFILIENLLLSILFKIAEGIGNLPFSKINMASHSVLFLILYYVFLTCFIFCREKIKKLYIENKLKIFSKIKSIFSFKNLLITVILCFFIIFLIPKRNLKIHFLDVGQGDACLVITPKRKTILIDGGNNEGYDYGEKVLLPYILKSGIFSIDYVIISHFDSDHIRSDCSRF